MCTLAWRILVLVAATRALPDPSSATARDKRHTVDTSGLTDAELLCRLTETTGTTNENCEDLHQPSQPAIASVGGSCTCAPVWQCRDNNVPGELVIEPQGFLNQVNVRTGSPCTTPEEVCCFDIDTTLQPVTPPFSPTCGKRNTEGIVTNFVGFQNRQSQFGEFPWMAAILTAEKFEPLQAPEYICGGSLIHSQVVLTAAHYVDRVSPSELSVRLGEWNFREPSESVSHQDYGVVEVLVHPNYVNTSLYYDMALLVLDRPVQLGHTVDTLCLPPPNYDFRDHICVVSGWGKDMFSDLGKYQQILKSIELPPVDHTRCQLAMRGTRLGQGFHLHQSFMCAGGEKNKDACEGDGGSPLACHKPGDPSKYYQAGVVSWGIGCGQEGIPGVYADVTKGVLWIDSIIHDRFGHDVRTNGK